MTAQAASTARMTPDPAHFTQLGEVDPAAAAGTLRLYVGDVPPLLSPAAARRASLKACIVAMRPHHWAKNVLLFVPLILAHDFTLASLLRAGSAFAAFCFCASAIYLINDIRDIDADRRHPTKRFRPIAAGELSVRQGIFLAAALLAGGLLVGAVMGSLLLFGALALYLALTSLYSFTLKRQIVIDVVLLANLYTLRILAGGFASGTAVSEWLLAFSIFLFLSLAFAKRYAELARLADAGHAACNSRGYVVADLSLIENLGPTSGYLAVLVFALYIHSDAVKQFYANTWALWPICVLLLYWITRLWFLAKRRLLAEDPLVFAIRDFVSLAIAASAGALLAMASIPWR